MVMEQKERLPVTHNFEKNDPASIDFQYIEDIAAAYWQSEVLFSALELGIFKHLAGESDGSNSSGSSGGSDRSDRLDESDSPNTLSVLAEKLSCNISDLQRFMRALQKMGLVMREGDLWFNSQSANIYLVPGRSSYMGDFFLYRKYMKSGWSTLTDRLSRSHRRYEESLAELESCHSDSSVSGDSVSGTPGPDSSISISTSTSISGSSASINDRSGDCKINCGNDDENENEDAYKRRNFFYVRAMDTLVREKAEEIADIVRNIDLGGRILDIGGGAGSMIRALRQWFPHMGGTLLDLPEVIEAAEEIYPDPSDWDGIDRLKGDFRTCLPDGRFGLVLMSNFLHAYSSGEAKEALFRAISLLDDEGVVIIHDYFPDRSGRSPAKGALYDLAMMLNTYNGECHESCEVRRWLNEAGVEDCLIQVADLSTDSSIIVAGSSYKLDSSDSEWRDIAISCGFENGVMIAADQLVTAPWVRKKCECGCEGYGKNLQCPPNGMSHRETAEMLKSYSRALVLEGMPPGRKFHENLLKLEKEAFLRGFHKAFVFGAGHCPVCPPCPENGICRNPDRARPSMEASGMDVYEIARRAGIDLEPVKRKEQYVKFIGLLLLE